MARVMVAKTVVVRVAGATAAVIQAGLAAAMARGRRWWEPVVGAAVEMAVVVRGGEVGAVAVCRRDRLLLWRGWWRAGWRRRVQR